MASKKIRYAVIGLGHIAQVAVLPSFKHAKNSELVALVSSDREKLVKLGRKYGVSLLCDYDQYDALLKSGEIDAVYIALPNHLHADYAVQALKRGVHVLCEKPMAVTSEECLKMIRASEASGAKLMVAYRLHFDEANLKAIELGRKKLGRLRYFLSAFSYTAKAGNIRLNDEDVGGGPLYDIGIYCINAARYLFQNEPTEVFASSVKSDRKRLSKIEDTITAVMKFPDETTATFTVSYDTADVSNFQLVGQKGSLVVDHAFEYAIPIVHYSMIGGKRHQKKFPKRDQFAPELVYFSNCVIKNKVPEPSGVEGYADVRIIEALFKSLRLGRPVSLAAARKSRYPRLVQAIKRPPVREPEIVNAEAPSEEAA